MIAELVPCGGRQSGNAVRGQQEWQNTHAHTLEPCCVWCAQANPRRGAAFSTQPTPGIYTCLQQGRRVPEGKQAQWGCNARRCWGKKAWGDESRLAT